MSLSSASPRAKLGTVVEGVVAASGAAWSAFVANNLEDRVAGKGLPLAVKYVPANCAGMYQRANDGLFIGAGYFTWGRGVYVTGVQEPLSTAIYGRAGVVSRFNPAGWRCFDARDPAHEDVYFSWLQAQPVYRDAALTVHSNYFLRKLRNLFRERFQIDVVMFRPDERDWAGWYTSPDDTWLVVSDWTKRRMLSARKYSSRFIDARLTILIEDEFKLDRTAMTRLPLLALSGKAPVSAGLPDRLRAVYAARDIERVVS